MPLFEFLVDVMRRFGAVFAVDAWYFTAVQAIGFLPRDQIESIMRAAGHPVLEPVCGLTTMRAWPDTGIRDVPQIWIAEPDSVCQAKDLGFFVAHELRHVWTWIVDGLTVWPGHN